MIFYIFNTITAHRKADLFEIAYHAPQHFAQTGDRRSSVPSHLITMQAWLKIYTNLTIMPVFAWNIVILI